MYRDFFGIAENPFSITPDPRYLYMSSGHEEALAHLLYGVGEGGGFVLLTGEVGTGKTSVCRCLLEQLPDTAAVALILNPRLDEIELLASICDEFGVAYPEGTRSLKVLVDLLNRHLLALHAAGRRGVVIIDEAQDLSPRVLEQVRLLTNLETATRKLLQVILIGQPELNALLERPELRQVVQRITARYHLQPLGRADTEAYIQHRLAVGGLAPDLFNWRAIAAVYRRARGVPRLINSLCDRCLLGAYAQNRKAVDARLVRRAAREVFGPSPKQRRRAARTLAWTTATAVVAGALLILDPANFGLLPQAEGWRSAIGTLLRGAPEASPDTARDLADIAQPEVTTAGRPADAPVAPAQATASAEAAGATAPEAAVAESAAGIRPAPVEAEVDVPEDTVPPPSATTASEPPVALTAEDDAGPPLEMAAIAPATADPEPPGEAPVAASIATPADSTAETEEIAPAPLLPDLPIPPLETESLAAVEAEAAQAVDAAARPKAVEHPSANGALEGATLQAAADPVPERAPSIADLFTRPSLSVDRGSALAALFGLWGLDDRRLGGPAHCASSARLGVRCLAEKTSWETLIGLNRPVLITLEDARGRRARAVLASVRDDRATLLVGAQRIVTDIATVGAFWSGEHLMLWRPPPVYSGLLALGARGQEVAWLRSRLAELNGEPGSDTGDPVFDATLQDKVMAFQNSRGLKPDGMVGVRTLIHLNTAAEAADVPLLRPAAP